MFGDVPAIGKRWEHDIVDRSGLCIALHCSVALLAFRWDPAEKPPLAQLFGEVLFLSALGSPGCRSFTKDTPGLLIGQMGGGSLRNPNTELRLYIVLTRSEGARDGESAGSAALQQLSVP